MGAYYVRHAKAEVVSAPKRLILALYKVGDRGVKYKPDKLAVEVKLRYYSKTHQKLF